MATPTHSGGHGRQPNATETGETTSVCAWRRAEVYRARDTRLGREVAIKVVSEALGANSDFVRFEREARLVREAR